MVHRMIKLRLEELLKQQAKTLYWLASPEGAGVEYGSLWRLKEGVSKSVSFELLDQICTALKCRPGDLLIQVRGETPKEQRKSRKGAK
jgi:DNA-binding Xre family transcriptional regulator